jgi:hypothetical protein
MSSVDEDYRAGFGQWAINISGMAIINSTSCAQEHSDLSRC